MGSNLPTVSVVVPCYNAARYLRAALDSVMIQTVSPLECLVVDDGSTDESAAIAASYGPPVRVIRQANSGRALADNRAIAEARGEVVMFLDADDFWLPGMIDAQLQTLVRTGAAMVYCPAYRCDVDGKDMPARVAHPLPERCVRELLAANVMNGCGACVRTGVLREVGGFDQRFWPADDYHLWLRIAARHRVAFQPAPLGRYRYYRGQASSERIGMLLVALGAKLDFLRSHPEVRRELGAEYVRQVVEEPFAQMLRRCIQTRQQSSARRLAAAYLRHWPTRARAWSLALQAHLPWRVFNSVAERCSASATA